MLSRKISRAVVLLFLLSYLPVLPGGGECFAICIDTDGAVRFDFSHLCGKTHDIPHGESDKTCAFSLTHHHKGGFKHIPVMIGNSTHTTPETSFVRGVNPALVYLPAGSGSQFFASPPVISPHSSVNSSPHVVTVPYPVVLII